ncbi:MAG: hypothetical protein IJB52_14155, partial [Clostridia bacterium]|nr:hypothetical protein [Clostridia bacterium]
VTSGDEAQTLQAWIRREGWEVSEGRGGRTERRLSTDFLPPLSSESRPEGHPLERLREYKTAVRQYEIHLPFYGHHTNHPAVNRTIIKTAKKKPKPPPSLGKFSQNLLPNSCFSGILNPDIPKTKSVRKELIS